MGPIKEGDRFFRVEHDEYRMRRADYVPRTGWVTVTSIGRKWASFQIDGRGWQHKNDRFNMETMKEDGAGFTSPARFYRSEEDWKESVHAQAVFREFRKRIDHMHELPPALTRIDILKAADALGFRLKEE